MSWRDGDAPSAMSAIAAPHATTPRSRGIERTLHRVHRPPRRRDSKEDDDIKSVTGGGLSLSVHSSLWDGMIQLSASVKVFMSAFYKSGEKILDIVWPDTIEIKGRVKLEAFQNFVKDLRHSRNRSIMVISLCWNVGSSKDGLEGIKEVAKRFEVNQRVGFAEIEKGPYIYVCPKSEAIITIFDKYGLWKGVSTVDTNQGSLIGFVVWDRNPLVNTSTIESSIEKVQEIRGTHIEAQDVTDDFPSRYVHADKTGKAVYRSEAAIPDSPSKLPSKLLLQLSQVTSFRVPSLVASQKSQVLQMSSPDIPSPPLETPETWQHVRPITDSHGGSLQVEEPNSHFHVVKKFTSAFKPYQAGVHGLPLQPLDATREAIHPDLATEKNHMMGAFSGSITQQKYASSDEFPELQQNRPLLSNLGSHTPDDKEDLPEIIFSPTCGAEVKPNVHPLNKETGGAGQIQQPSHSFFHVESPRPRKNVGAQGTSAYMVSSKITDLSHYSMERECFRENNGFDDEDKTVQRPSELDHEKLLENGSTESLLPSLETSTMAKSQLWSFPHINPRPQSPPETAGVFIDHHPHRPSGSLNPLRDEGLFFHHHPDAEAERGLFPRHPPLVPADQGLFHGHRPPPLSDQGLYPLYLPHVPADQCLFRQHPPPVLAEQGSHPPHPPPGLPDQGFYPQHPPVPADQGFFHWHHPRVLGDQGFISHRPLSSAPGYFGSSGYHGNNNGNSPDPQHWMFGQRPQTSYASASSQHMGPPSGFAPGHAWCPMSHPRPGNNQHGFERSDGFSGSSTGHYSGPGNGSGSSPPAPKVIGEISLVTRNILNNSS